MIHKGLIIVVIILFIVASVCPSITGYDKDIYENEINVYNKVFNKVVEVFSYLNYDLLEKDKQLASDRELLEKETSRNMGEKTQLSFAAFADTHIGIKYKYPLRCGIASYLDLIGRDLTDSTNLLDFAIHLGDIINQNTAQVNGEGLPWNVNQYKNNLKAYLISNVNLPFHFILLSSEEDDLLKKIY